MKWIVDFSDDSLKFLKKNKISEDYIIEKIELTLKRLKGEDVNVDIKKLKGKWEGFFRIRFGKLRIIAEFQFQDNRVYVERIDWRGNVYK
jgi:mRNA-degrading endonuclease RelE of RelBE toxin-antitoxin system